jgi:hypothetical protein
MANALLAFKSSMRGMKPELASHGDVLQIGVKQTTLISINVLIKDNSI